VAGEHLSVEIHYFDFDADLYDHEISVSILQFLRPEQKFESVALLKGQLEKDKKTALYFLKK
jgi:riboflavin kinase/FMN adenylyltransferase